MWQLNLFLALTLAACSVAVAQPGAEPDAARPDTAQSDPALAAAEAPLRSYVVQLTEYRLKSPLDDDLTASEIVERLAQLKNDGKLDWIESVQLSALEGHASFVHFGKTTAVTVATSSGGPGRGAVRQFQDRSVGTQFELLAMPEAGKTRIQLAYDASRFADDGTEESPPSTSTVRVDTTLLLDFETPVLIGGSNAETPTFITLTIHP